MVNFIGKNILMFYTYGATGHLGEAIKKELISRGASVIGYDERPSQNTFVKIGIRLLKNKVPHLIDLYIKKIISDNAHIQFDYILICKGEAFTPHTFSLLRKAYPNAKIILYLWDILKCADLRRNIPFADKAFSFDPQDVEENEGLIFRPTFYDQEYKDVEKCQSPKYDVMFIGTLHSDRHLVIKEVEKRMSGENRRFYSYLYVPSRLVYIRDLIKKFPYVSLNKVHFVPISVSGIIDVLKVSKAILEINYTGQKSLTTRAFEALAAKRKYITTNPEVMKYDFYNPNNIAVVDINNFLLPEKFLDTPFEDIDETVVHRYSVAGVVDDLFDGM